MAGAGYKLFNTGDVLTAAQVNTYLMQQTVMVFADSSARTTALSGVLAEGMLSYLQDTNAVEVYNGSAWVGVSSDQIPLTTKGDLLTYSTQDTRLGVGTNGQVLTADSTTATGLKWASAAGGAANWSLLNSGGTTLSGSSTTVSGISGKDKIMVFIENASFTTDAYLRVEINSDSANHYNFRRRFDLSSTWSPYLIKGENTSNEAGIYMTYPVNANNYTAGYVLITGCNTSGVKVYQFEGTVNANDYNNDGSRNYDGAGYYNSSSTISSIRVTGGTLDGGKVYVYASE